MAVYLGEPYVGHRPAAWWEFEAGRRVCLRNGDKAL